MKKITVVVSTWRRPEILNFVLIALARQSLAMSEFEVIVVDSNSGDETPVVVRSAQIVGLDVRLVHSDVNSVSAKRNKGITLAQGRYIAFLDDDCVPLEDHLEVFLLFAESSAGARIIWCGGVRFSNELVRESNYYKYRDGCHYSSFKKLPERLGFQNIVTMNMFVERTLIEKDKLFFDERFVGYGFEDLEFGFRAERTGYQLLPCTADIEHMEPLGSISKFSNKFFHAARDGMPVYLAATDHAVNSLGQSSWLEPSPPDEQASSKIKRRFVHCLLDSPLPRIIGLILGYVDRFPFVYSKLLYRFVLAGAYRAGVRARLKGEGISVDRANRDGWYS